MNQDLTGKNRKVSKCMKCVLNNDDLAICHSKLRNRSKTLESQ